MIRTQIQLTEQQTRGLRALSRREGVSMSALIRRSVDRLLAEQAPERTALYARAATLVGAFPDPSGSTDISSEHDRVLVEAYE